MAWSRVMSCFKATWKTIFLLAPLKLSPWLDFQSSLTFFFFGLPSIFLSSGGSIGSYLVTIQYFRPLIDRMGYLYEAIKMSLLYQLDTYCLMVCFLWLIALITCTHGILVRSQTLHVHFPYSKSTINISWTPT